METKKKILIVDDEPDLIDVMNQRLTSNGYDVISAYNGRQALDKLAQKLPDLIIADILMPEMDGYSFYKELKKDQRTAGIPVIIVTARSKMEDTFSAVGVDAFLVKPFDAKVLLDKVAELILKKKDAKSPVNDILPAGDVTKGQHKHLGLIVIVVFLLMILTAVGFIVSYMMSTTVRSPIVPGEFFEEETLPEMPQATP